MSGAVAGAEEALGKELSREGNSQGYGREPLSQEAEGEG